MTDAIHKIAQLSELALTNGDHLKITTRSTSDRNTVLPLTLGRYG